MLSCLKEIPTAHEDTSNIVLFIFQSPFPPWLQEIYSTVLLFLVVFFGISVRGYLFVMGFFICMDWEIINYCFLPAKLLWSLVFILFCLQIDLPCFYFKDVSMLEISNLSFVNLL